MDTNKYKTSNQGIFVPQETIPNADTYADFATMLGVPITSVTQDIQAMKPQRTKDPICTLKTQTDKSGVITYIISRYTHRTWWGKKVNHQTTMLRDIRSSDFAYYSGYVVKLEQLFLDYQAYAMKAYNEIYPGDMHKEPVLSLFENFTISTLPSTIYYIQNEMTKDQTAYLRFKRYLATVDFLIPRDIISTLQVSLLSSVLEIYRTCTLVGEEQKMVTIETTPYAFNEIVDMLLFAPWSYNFLLCKHLDLVRDSLPMKTDIAS